VHTPASAVGARGGDKSGAGVCDKGTAGKLDKENSDSNHLISIRWVEWGEGGKEGGGAAEYPSAAGCSCLSVFLIQTYFTCLCMSPSTHLARRHRERRQSVLSAAPPSGAEKKESHHEGTAS